MKFNGNKQKITDSAGDIGLLLLDVDGVMTDGRLHYGASGEELKVFNTLDGHGIKMLQRAGVEVGIISGRDSAPLDRRARDLGIRMLYKGREDKLNVLQEIIGTGDLESSAIAFAGDDLPDLAVMKLVGLAITVPNAHQEIRSMADLETENTGGNGAVREICDFLLQAKGLYEQVLAAHQGN